MSSADLPFFPKNRGRVSRPDPRKPRGRECFSSGRANKPALISFLPKKKVSHNCTFTKKTVRPCGGNILRPAVH